MRQQDVQEANHVCELGNQQWTEDHLYKSPTPPVLVSLKTGSVINNYPNNLKANVCEFTCGSFTLCYMIRSEDMRQPRPDQSSVYLQGRHDMPVDEKGK